MSEQPSESEHPGEHGSELPDGREQSRAEQEVQEENAATSLNQPSQ